MGILFCPCVCQCVCFSHASSAMFATDQSRLRSPKCSGHTATIFLLGCIGCWAVPIGSWTINSLTSFGFVYVSPRGQSIG